MANSVDSVQTAPIGAVCSGSTLFASILNSSVMLGNYLQKTTSADDIFRCIFFLGALRVKCLFVVLPAKHGWHIEIMSLSHFWFLIRVGSKVKTIFFSESSHVAY